MDIVSLRTFLSLADTGSFSRSAEQLHVTQPAVSKRIAALEFSLGVNLFDRIGKQVQLTEAGRALIPGSQRILAEMDEAQRILSNMHAYTHGTLSMATSHHVGLHRLPAILSEYSSAHPDVELDIRFMDSEQAFPSILHGEIEFAIVTLPDSPIAHLQQVRLWSDPMKCVVAHDHALADRDKVTAKQLLQYPAILSSAGTHTRKLVEMALGDIPQQNILLETSFLETIKAMVQARLGWSVLPASMIDDSMVTLPLRKLKLDRHLGLVLHRDRTLSNAANRMLALLGIDAGVIHTGS